jgi:hypothetical protein
MKLGDFDITVHLTRFSRSTTYKLFCWVLNRLPKLIDKFNDREIKEMLTIIEGIEDKLE